MIHGNLDGLGEDEDIDNKVIIERFFGLAGAPVTSYCGSKEKFIGRYHGYGNPVGVESGKLSGEMNYNGNSCGALATVIRLAPGEERQIAFLLGMKYEEEAVSYTHLDVYKRQIRNWLFLTNTNES